MDFIQGNEICYFAHKHSNIPGACFQVKVDAFGNKVVESWNHFSPGCSPYVEEVQLFQVLTIIQALQHIENLESHADWTRKPAPATVSSPGGIKNLKRWGGAGHFECDSCSGLGGL